MILYIIGLLKFFSNSQFSQQVYLSSGIAYLDVRQSGRFQNKEKKQFLVAISSYLMIQIVVSLIIEKHDLVPENKKAL